MFAQHFCCAIETLFLTFNLFADVHLPFTIFKLNVSYVAMAVRQVKILIGHLCPIRQITTFICNIFNDQCYQHIETNKCFSFSFSFFLGKIPMQDFAIQGSQELKRKACSCLCFVYLFLYAKLTNRCGNLKIKFKFRSIVNTHTHTQKRRSVEFMSQIRLIFRKHTI